MNTRFSPSLNGSLHLGHLYMAWVNKAVAQSHGGRFLLRFDDLAPRFAGDSVDHMPKWAAEAESLLCMAGLEPDEVTYLSAHLQKAQSFPEHVAAQNRWLRAADLEGHHNLPNSPMLVAARVMADIAEDIGIVIRGEELLPELQLYEYLNAQFGGPTREMIYLPRMRVRCNGQVTTISKTYGNLQLRDLFQKAPPETWMRLVLQTILIDPAKPFSWDNLHRDPIFEIAE
jgi:glutamyl/glutaminyl-tRNA synthetase